MDASFYARSQTVSLTSSFLPPLRSFLSPNYSLRLIEFPSCGRNLKPPEFRYRRKCRNVLFRVQSSRFMIRALNSQSNLILITISVSALAVVMFARCQGNKRNISENTARQDFESPNLERDKQYSVENDAMEEIMEAGGATKERKEFGDEMKETKEIGGAATETKENGHVYEDEAMRVQIKGNDFVDEEENIANGLTKESKEIIAKDSTEERKEIGGAMKETNEIGDAVTETKEIEHACEDEAMRVQLKGNDFVPEEEIIANGLKKETKETIMKSSTKETQEIGGAMKKTKEIGHAYEDEAMQVQLKGNDFVSEEEIIANGLKSPASSTTSSTDHYSTPIHSEVAEVLQPLAFATKISNLQAEPVSEVALISSELPMLSVESIATDLSVPMDVLSGGVDVHRNAIHELGKMDNTMSSSFVSRESYRDGLYTFFEVDQLGDKDILLSNHVEKLGPQSTIQRQNKFSALLRKYTSDGRDKPTYVFINNAGTNRTGDDCRLAQLPSHLNGMPVNERHYISKQISSYKNLLKNGRLIECIQLLEELERKGLLNMEKIHHAEFLRMCKKKKAVKEAFNFTRLIQSPTLSTFNMLMFVCACSRDSSGAFEVLNLVQEAGLKPDCKLYTTLISTCARCGKVDEMFKVFHEMVNAGVEPNVHTYGTLIDGCAKAGQIAKAFGAYGILRSKNVQPDRVIFNALITACGQSGAVDRAFDVLAEMRAETHPIDPDQVTVGALIKACTNAGQIHRVREVYNMIQKYNIKGSPEVYTIAINSCSLSGDMEFACSVYDDMKRNGVLPDEMFFSALVDVMGHAHNLDGAFEILEEVKKQGIREGTILYSSLMGACSNAKNWQKALELYEDIKSRGLKLTVSTLNALITALCEGDQVQKALEVLSEMKRTGLRPNIITYSVLLAACEKEDNLEAALMLYSEAKNDGVTPNLVMSRCIMAMCPRRFMKACALGEPVLSFNSGRPQVDSRWTSIALKVYRETMMAGIVPGAELFSQVLGCLRFPFGAGLRDRMIENMQVSGGLSRRSNLCSLIDGFGEYDPRAFSLFEEAASLGIVPCVSLKESPIIIDARELHIHTTEVYILTVLKGLKHRLAAGAKLPNVSIMLPFEKMPILSPTGNKEISIAGRTSQSIAALLRRLGLIYVGSEANGKIRINGVVIKKWLQPKLHSPFDRNPMELGSSQSRLGKGIIHQQRNIRTGNLSLD
ncbi:pentatricopeptide repeat-containing protein MRL1, chloroplastic-like [Impatiens glandulifera]|uniref:pentatricopeptide repeat-containing protein MRL1, chloroplastic-like n=1 Tax=Impatiens glandulifera TaxID=253017 RepID=UPI001FB0F86B|nr:pentatricopeptide repeat-containing protein MRL1, chloroplastic-like [Impatiens glandulifera]